MSSIYKSLVELVCLLRVKLGVPNLLPLFNTAVIYLIVFTIVATVMYHNPFKSTKKYYEFINHLSIIGGLLALYMANNKYNIFFNLLFAN